MTSGDKVIQNSSSNINASKQAIKEQIQDHAIAITEEKIHNEGNNVFKMSTEGN